MLHQVMSRWHFLVLPILAMVLLGTARGEASRGESRVSVEIVHAVRAPYEAVLNRNAAELCGDFTPTVSADLVARAPEGSTCESAASALFASTTNEHALLAALLAKLTVTSIVSHGGHASATLEDTRVREEGRNRVRVTLESEPVALEESEGRWLISSPARLGSIDSCAIHNIRPSRCTTNARVLVFGIITTSTTSGPSLPPIPAAVKRAGGEQLVDFKAGRTVYAQSGCAACHRLGDFGNAGPGPNLTHIGSTLSTPQLERALVDPHAPMPSFSHLPAAKFKAVVEFLSLLH
jgi:Cytochrome C oxidase, cbb3-type, subunit III